MTCPAGYFCPDRGSQAPTACGAGSYNPSTGSAESTACLSCPLGRVNANKGSISSAACELCPAGFFCSTPAAQVVCPAGSYCPLNATDPIACPLGAYCEKGAANWTVCPSGSFADRTGRPDASCSGPCAAGRYGDTPGAQNSSCDGPCAAGFYCVAGSTTATAARCPNGTTTAQGQGTKGSDCKGEPPTERVDAVTVALVGSGVGGLQLTWYPGKSIDGSSPTAGYAAACQQMRTPSIPDTVGDAFVEVAATVSDAVLDGGVRLATIPSSALQPSCGYRCRVAPLNDAGRGGFSDWSLPVRWYVRAPETPVLDAAEQLSRESNAARYVTVSGSLRSGVNGEAVVMSDATLSIRYGPATDVSAADTVPFNRSSAADGCQGSREVSVTGAANGLRLWQPNAASSNWRFSFSVLLCDQRPYAFSVSATNIGGAASNWSGWSAPVSTNCSAGTYLAAGGQQCESCPEGAACRALGLAPNVTTLAAVPNWWRAPWVVDATAAFTPCAPLSSDGTTACLGSNRCAAGYGGVLCQECLAGYARSGAAGCSACPEPWRSWLALLGVGMLAVLLLAFLVRAALRSRGEPSRLEVIMLKVLMSHLQTVALAAEFDLRWPSWLAGLFAVSDASSSLSDAVLSLDCVLPAAQAGSGAAVFSGAALTLCAPFLCAAAAALFWFTPRGACTWFATAPPASASPVAGGAQKTAAELANPKFVAFSVTLIVILSTMHASLSKAALRLLTCRPLAGRHWLAADMSVECWVADSPHARYGVPLGSLAIIFFVIGIPAGNAFVLYRRRHKLARTDTRIRFGFLYASYRLDTFFWDSVVLLRKLAIAVVAVFLRPAGAGLQAFAAQIAAFCALSVQLLVQPYANARVNALDAYSLGTQLATFTLSILLYLSDTAESLKVTASLGVLGANIAYLIYFFLVFFRESTLARAAAGRLSGAATHIGAAALSFHVRRATRLSNADVGGGDTPVEAVELAAVPPRDPPGLGVVMIGAMVTNPVVRRSLDSTIDNGSTSLPEKGRGDAVGGGTATSAANQLSLPIARQIEPAAEQRGSLGATPQSRFLDARAEAASPRRGPAAALLPARSQSLVSPHPHDLVPSTLRTRVGSVAEPRTPTAVDAIVIGWIEARDAASGRPYWYNSAGQTTWAKPSEASRWAAREESRERSGKALASGSKGAHYSTNQLS
jgi:hypothetical protein